MTRTRRKETPREAWETYESCKRVLAAKGLPQAEYEAGLREIAERLGL